MPLRKKKKKKLLSCSPTASQTCDRIRNSLCCWVYSSTLVDKNQHSVQGIFVTFFRVISVHLFSPLILNQTKKNNNTLWGTRFLSSAYIKPNESGKMAPTQQPHPVEHNANPQTALFVSTFLRRLLSRRIVSIGLLERRCFAGLT